MSKHIIRILLFALIFSCSKSSDIKCENIKKITSGAFKRLELENSKSWQKYLEKTQGLSKQRTEKIALYVSYFHKKSKTYKKEKSKILSQYLSTYHCK